MTELNYVCQQVYPGEAEFALIQMGHTLHLTFMRKTFGPRAIKASQHIAERYKENDVWWRMLNHRKHRYILKALRSHAHE